MCIRDRVEAEKTLVGIIEELDTGMRKQFLEKFAEIQTEFDLSLIHIYPDGNDIFPGMAERIGIRMDSVLADIVSGGTGNDGALLCGQ